eukprot:4553151-Pyramimonas_sp.AAC.1
MPPRCRPGSLEGLSELWNSLGAQLNPAKRFRDSASAAARRNCTSRGKARALDLAKLSVTPRLPPRARRRQLCTPGSKTTLAIPRAPALAPPHVQSSFSSRNGRRALPSLSPQAPRKEPRETTSLGPKAPRRPRKTAAASQTSG